MARECLVGLWQRWMLWQRPYPPFLHEDFTVKPRPLVLHPSFCAPNSRAFYGFLWRIQAPLHTLLALAHTTLLPPRLPLHSQPLSSPQVCPLEPKLQHPVPTGTSWLVSRGGDCMDPLHQFLSILSATQQLLCSPLSL